MGNKAALWTEDLKSPRLRLYAIRHAAWRCVCTHTVDARWCAHTHIHNQTQNVWHWAPQLIRHKSFTYRVRYVSISLMPEESSSERWNVKIFNTSCEKAKECILVFWACIIRVEGKVGPAWAAGLELVTSGLKSQSIEDWIFNKDQRYVAAPLVYTFYV